MGTQGLDVSLKGHEGTSLIVQWFRLHVPNARDMVSMPGRVTKIPHASVSWPKKIRYNNLFFFFSEKT